MTLVYLAIFSLVVLIVVQQFFYRFFEYIQKNKKKIEKNISSEKNLDLRMQTREKYVKK